jgi:hypothetical protein
MRTGMKHRGLIAVALAGLGWLAFTAPARSASASVAGRPLLAVHEDPEPFLFQSPGRSHGDVPAEVADPLEEFFGVFMSGEQQADGGRRLIARFKLADPAPAIAGALARETCPLIACAGIVREVENNTLTLSVRTTAWAVRHLTFAWNRYRIHYKVDARLLDDTTNRVLASGEFVYTEKFKDADEAPVLEELLGEDGALLKSKFRDVEPLAVSHLKQEFEKDLRLGGWLAKG